MVGRARCGAERYALAETYSVLTRLPSDARVAPVDAAQLLRERFAAPLTMGLARASRLPELLARLGTAGGAGYDALLERTPGPAVRGRAHATDQAHHWRSS